MGQKLLTLCLGNTGLRHNSMGRREIRSVSFRSDDFLLSVGPLRGVGHWVCAGAWYTHEVVLAVFLINCDNLMTHVSVAS